MPMRCAGGLWMGMPRDDFTGPDWGVKFYAPTSLWMGMPRDDFTGRGVARLASFPAHIGSYPERDHWDADL